MIFLIDFIDMSFLAILKCFVFQLSPVILFAALCVQFTATIAQIFISYLLFVNKAILLTPCEADAIVSSENP